MSDPQRDGKKSLSHSLWNDFMSSKLISDSFRSFSAGEGFVSGTTMKNLKKIIKKRLFPIDETK
jgi:hypothetical protein